MAAGMFLKTHHPPPLLASPHALISSPPPSNPPPSSAADAAEGVAFVEEEAISESERGKACTV